MFQPEFLAVCDACAQVTPWFKANRMAEGDRGVPMSEKGFKCAVCGVFEPKVLDTRGRIHARP